MDPKGSKSFLFLIALIVLAVLETLPSAASTSPETTPAFAVEVHGEGRPVMLIPGLGSPATAWDTTVEPLVAEGFQAMLDQPERFLELLRGHLLSQDGNAMEEAAP